MDGGLEEGGMAIEIPGLLGLWQEIKTRYVPKSLRCPNCDHKGYELGNWFICKLCYCFADLNTGLAWVKEGTAVFGPEPAIPGRHRWLASFLQAEQEAQRKEAAENPIIFCDLCGHHAVKGERYCPAHLKETWE